MKKKLLKTGLIAVTLVSPVAIVVVEKGKEKIIKNKIIKSVLTEGTIK